MEWKIYRRLRAMLCMYFYFACYIVWMMKPIFYKKQCIVTRQLTSIENITVVIHKQNYILLHVTEIVIGL